MRDYQYYVGGGGGVGTHLSQTKVALIAPCGVMRSGLLASVVGLAARATAILSYVPCCWNMLWPFLCLILALLVLVVLAPLLFLILIRTVTVMMVIAALARCVMGGRRIYMWQV
jgi:hypothetical protein